MTEIVIQKLRIDLRRIRPYRSVLLLQTKWLRVTSSRRFESVREFLPSIMIGPSVRDESSQEQKKDLRDYCSASLNRSIKPKRAIYLSIGDRRTSAEQTCNDSIWSCTRCWTSSHQSRHWHPSSHSRELKSKGSSIENDGNVKREDIADIEWRFSLSRWRIWKECRRSQILHRRCLDDKVIWRSFNVEDQ